MSGFQNFLQAFREIVGIGNQQENNPQPAANTQDEAKERHFQESEGKTTPKADKPPKATYENQPRPLSQSQEDVTIISKNTMVMGNVRSFEDMRVKGKVEGNIETTKSLDVSGVIKGDTVASTVALSGATIKGNVSSEGGFLIDKNSIMYGDIEAQNGKFDGKIKGNLAIGGEAAFYANSVILGDILVSNVSVERGAKIKGYINTNVPDSLGEEYFADVIDPEPTVDQMSPTIAPSQEQPIIDVVENEEVMAQSPDVYPEEPEVLEAPEEEVTVYSDNSIL